MRDLLGRMTLEEKFWQLYMTPGDLARADALHIDSIQRFFVERTRGSLAVR